MEKQHKDLGGHKNYLIPEDKRRVKLEFGVLHYAGPVMYNINQFLEKNKDVQQDMLFDFMRLSSVPFVKDICRFQVQFAISALGRAPQELEQTGSIHPRHLL